MDKETIDLLLKLGQLAVAVGGAFGVTWYWNRTKHCHDQYRFLDEGYSKLLKLYLDNPRFGNPRLTVDFERNFKGADALRYHYFAMTVHTLMETIYDVSKCRGEIWQEWKHIFCHHSNLHSDWLKQHQDLQERGYVSVVLGCPGPASG